VSALQANGQREVLAPGAQRD